MFNTTRSVVLQVCVAVRVSLLPGAVQPGVKAIFVTASRRPTPLPNEVEALEGTGEAEDETWIPATALRAKSFEKGEEAKVVGLKQLKEAWEAYDEWSEDYAWQAGQSAFILDLDEEDGTVLLKFTEEAPEVKETEVAVTFQNAPIKHIKAKTLKPFKKRFAKTLVMFYRAASLCGHCPAIKPKFALVADYVMQRTGGKDFSGRGPYLGLCHGAAFYKNLEY